MEVKTPRTPPPEVSLPREVAEQAKQVKELLEPVSTFYGGRWK